MRRVKFYLDSNVFIFAEISREEIGEDARKVVRNLEKFTGIVSP
jgi:predicted nucleic acid-binding protein